jgi:hypothetical protein
MNERSKRNEQTNHNLNIQSYTLDELLSLFELPKTPSLNDMKRAKRQVLMVHPDKSKLSPEYFLFYKKAFDIVVQYYEETNKQNKIINEKTDTEYDISSIDTNHDKSLAKTINSIEKKQFQTTFNQLFETNMINKEEQERKKSQHEWFAKNDPLYDISETVSVKNMGQVIENVKKQNQHIIKYEGVKELHSGNRGSHLYGEEEGYASSDPFSKLKFDDLRRVHKDQTVFSVSEDDFHKVKQYNSVEHYVRERDAGGYNCMEKTEAEMILRKRQEQDAKRLHSLAHMEKMRTMGYEAKNKEILSSFLHLENGV